VYAQEKTPALIDPAGPTISLISSEPVFVMSAALNACGYDEGLEKSSAIRQRIRDEMSQAFAKSEEARQKRDALCLYIAQHRLTGSEQDIAQYISLSLYLTPPPALEVAADLTEMPPDATQVVEVMPLLREFAAAVDLDGIWLTAHRAYDEEAAKLHDSLSQTIVDTNIYLKMPAATYNGSRFVVVIEPELSPATVNARIYGTDYIVVVSPVNGKIPLTAVRHTYLHYVIEPMLYAGSSVLERAARVSFALRPHGAERGVPDQGHRGADDGYGRSRVQDSRRHRPLAVAALRARTRTLPAEGGRGEVGRGGARYAPGLRADAILLRADDPV
jgi:hypothetical protein